MIITKNNSISWIRFLPKLAVWIPIFSHFSCLNNLTPRNPSAGPNLGFEFSEKGLPLNWILYNPPGIEQKISLDTNNPKEGNQSLRFDVVKKSDDASNGDAGFTNEFMEQTKGGGRYRLSFWVKNQGMTFRMQAGGVKAKESAGTVIREESGYITDWKQYEIDTDIAPDMWLRFEIRLKGKGSFWIDGVEIQKR